jgi:hypothetical protein
MIVHRIPVIIPCSRVTSIYAVDFPYAQYHPRVRSIEQLPHCDPSTPAEILNPPDRIESSRLCNEICTST